MSIIKTMDKIYESTKWKIRKVARIRSQKKFLKSKIVGAPGLTENQISQIKKFWDPYCKFSYESHIYYTLKFGEFRPEFIPNAVFMNYIDKYYNNAKKAVVLENKCYFKKMFPNVKQPDTVCYRMNGFWYTPENEITTFENAVELIKDEPTIIVKQAIGSSGGHDVNFLDKSSGRLTQEFKSCVAKINEDIIVQRPIRQHAILSQLNSSSVNSLRVVSLLHKDGTVKVYSVVLRMGVGGMRVDNESSGGVNCGVTPDGKLRAEGHTKSAGGIHKTHPTTGIVFKDFEIPYFDKVMETVKAAHITIPHFRLVSWDFAIGEDGTPIMIEANLNGGGININQVNNGPIFGEDTKMILDEVFGKDKIALSKNAH